MVGGGDWTIALAGGDGVRLADYVERRFGARVPKQYCRLLGARSMLEHTLDRANALTPPARTLAVIGTHHAAWAEPQLAGRCDHVLRQPEARETGTAIYVALAYIRRWAPDALVTITPTDHYVAPAARYVAELARARSLAAAHPGRVVLVGARPTDADPDLGYIAGGPRCAPDLRTVLAFVEKPPAGHARALIAEGAVWNTMVCCATARALWELGRATVPGLIDQLDALAPRLGDAFAPPTDAEDDALAALYATSPRIAFSRDVLERAPDRLLVSTLDGVTWTDWGRPERIEATLARRAQRSRHAAEVAQAS